MLSNGASGGWGPTLNNIDKSVARVLEAYKSAVYAKDAGALIKLYEPRVRVFDAWGVWSHEGAEAWQRAIEGWFTSLGSERVKVTFGDVQVSAERDSAIVTCIVTYGTAPAGEGSGRKMGRDGRPVDAAAGDRAPAWTCRAHRGGPGMKSTSPHIDIAKGGGVQQWTGRLLDMSAPATRR